MGWRPASCCPRRSPSLLPVLTRGAATSPPGLAALCRALTSLRGLRLARSPLRYRIASPTSRSEPRLLSARPLRGSALPAYRSPTLCVVAPPSPLLPDGLPSSVPPPPLPGSRPGHLLPYGIAASASDSLCPRFPLSSLPDGLPPLSPTLCAVASLSPPAGWAAASVSDSLCRRFPLSSCRMGCRLCLRLSVPSLPPLLLPDGLLPLPPTTSIASSLCRRRPIPSCRMGCRPRSRGTCGQMLSPVRSGAPPTCHASAGRGSAPRRPGERSAPPVRPSCGACEISRPRKLRPPTAT